MKIIGLDVGTKRIGVARADSSVKIAIPQTTLEVDGTEFDKIRRFSDVYGTKFFIIGLPRNSGGEETAQSRYSRDFAKRLKNALPDAKIQFQDESLTSVEAENRLKSRKKPYQKGEIDAEAAAIILQDFIENITTNSFNTEEKEEMNQTEKKPKRKHAALTILIIFFVAGLFGALITFMYNGSLSAVSQANCEENSPYQENDPCIYQDIIISEGMTTSDIANALKERDLIQNQFSFQLYAKFGNYSDNMQAGRYKFNKTMSVQKIVSMIVEGKTADETFRIMTIPGETLEDYKKTLFSLGYSSQDIDEAFLAVEDHPVLSSKPKEASLEGYIFGETIEFDKNATPETITRAFLDELYSVVKENSLEEKYQSHGLSLHEGIILASVVQRESNSSDMKNVASVFYNRLEEGMTLGSDVTASYAVDQVDPKREIYTDNAAVLSIDSCYNTRINPGLPCGPISNPGLEALFAVADPADTPYLYFLTGDDGLMYYGTTESDHQMNIETHCQEFCNIQL